ncbi:MAG: hypothetical protein EXR18_01810 [Flavobacteriaceae bacterium]|nr:hypothetical protein [Flavobacteriaceae bacterium]
MASFNYLPDVSIESADKYVHFTFHFVFLNLWFLYFNSKNQKNSFYQVLFIFLVSILFGILIELAQQAFTTTRKGDIFDVFANLTGAFSALILILIYLFDRKSKLQ